MNRLATTSSDTVPDSRSSTSTNQPAAALPIGMTSSNPTTQTTECFAASNGVTGYGQDHILVDFTDYTTGLLDINSEVEVSNTEVMTSNGCPGMSPELNSEKDTSEVAMTNHVESARRARASSEDTLYCFCQQPWDQQNIRFMIECTHCKGWFHGSCVGVPESLGSAIEFYYCKVCEPIAGPIIYKDPNEKPIKAGTKEFLRKLKGKEYLSAEKIMLQLKGDDLRINAFYKNGFAKPILVHDKAGLEMRVPKSNFSVREVEAYVGSDTEVDVIDVERQTDIKMTMKEFCDYYTYPGRNKLYNLISLEFSKTRLNNLVMAPGIVRKLDWMNSWKVQCEAEVPSVSKYCLISTKESFTDFHIDFGGTSVWYHVLWGEKVFYLIEPTPTNLLLYQRWMSSNPQDYETFFGDTVDYCYQIVLKAGQTLFIPTGWIHAVLTTQDSLVFGGNFLHHLSVDLQLKVYEIEKTLHVPSKYLFPYFETCTWYAAGDLVDVFESLNNRNLYPSHFIEGLRALGKTLRSWIGEDTVAREVAPKIVRPDKLVRKINKIVRKYDRRQRQPIMKLSNPNRKGSLSGSLQSTSNPTSPDMVSGSSSESDIIKRTSLSTKRRIRISDSSASPTYTPDHVSTTSIKPIKIKFRKISMSDTSTHTSPDRPSQSSSITSSYLQNPSPSSSYSEFKYTSALSPPDKTQNNQLAYSASATESIQEPNYAENAFSVCTPLNNALPEDVISKAENNATDFTQAESQESLQDNSSGSQMASKLYIDTDTNSSSTCLRIVEPDYYDENGFGHYITNNILVEPIDEESQETAKDDTAQETGSSNNQVSSPKFRTIEPENVDENGQRHYISPCKLAVLEPQSQSTGSSNTITTSSNLTAENLRNFEAGNQASSTEGGTAAASTESSMHSSQHSPVDGTQSSGADDLVMAYSSDSSESAEEKHKHRSHKHRSHRKHHHRSKKSKKAKSRDSSESRYKKHKKHRKHKHSESASLNYALAGALDGMESLLKDSKYNERLAESAQRSSTSASMKEAIAEIIENESVPLEKRLKRSKSRKVADPWAEENIQKVHQDDNYIYLPLAGESSDEEISPKKRKVLTKDKRKEKDVWSPNVKVGQLTKREACPTRTKAKVLAVEKGLENAAAVLAKEQKRPKMTAQSKKKSPELKLKVVKPHSDSKTDNNEWRLVSGGGGVNGNPGPSTSAQKPATAASTKPPKKGKKGLMTPKQRLGKILGLGKFR